MSTITYAIENLRNCRDALYCRHDGQTRPQDAHVALDEDGHVTAGYNPEIGPAVPMAVWHSRTRWYSVPPTSDGPALAQLLESEEAQVLFTRIHAGHSIEWDGRNHVGRITEDAQSAEEELADLLQSVDQVDVWSAADWIDATPISVLWPSDLTLAQAAQAVEDEAECPVIEGCLMDAIADKAAQRPLLLTDAQRTELIALGKIEDETE